MPIRENREYRSMPVLQKMAVEERKPLIESDYYVEGYATTFEDPYLLFVDGQNKFFERVAKTAFENADMDDVIFLHDHEGKCFARTRMKPGANPTLLLVPDDFGLFVAADLGMTAEGRDEYAAITGGLIYQMSFAFTVKDDDIEELEDGSLLRTIKSFRKIYDVSSVTAPANPGTFIDASARSAFDGFIEAQKQERLRAEAIARQRQRIRILTEVTR